MDELKDEHGGEEGLLSEVIDNDKISKGVVQKRIKEIKSDKDYADELKVLEQYLRLFEKEAETKQEIKDQEKALEQKILGKYPKLSLSDVKMLVVERKWMEALESRIMGEVERLSQTLAGRIKELALLYGTTLPTMGQEVEAYTAKIEGHLKKMGFTLK
jgi:type I restriction enzyme M protein